MRDGRERGSTLALRARRIIGATALSAACALAAAEQALAERIVVKNTKAKGKGSFRWAVKKANSDRDRDKILFPSRLSGDIAIGRVDLTRPVALRQRGRDLVLAGKHPDSRILLDSPSTNSDLARASAMRGLRTEGLGISVDPYSELTIARSRISGASEERAAGVADEPDGARGGPAGSGVYAYSADVKIRRTTISGFEIGVRNSDSGVSIESSELTANAVGTSNYKAATRVEASTITGSTEAAIVSGYYGFTSLKNSTVSYNPGAAFEGSGKVRSSTIYGNGSAFEGPYGYAPEVSDSIVIGNGAAATECTIAGGQLESTGGNVFGLASSCAADAHPSDLQTADAGLGPLADNGGPTRTHALEAGSPAIGQAKGRAPLRDQRGLRRDDDPDSGSFERGA